MRAKKVVPSLPDAAAELGVTPAADSAVTAKPQQGGGGNQMVCGTPGGLPDTMLGTFIPTQLQVVRFEVPQGHVRGMPLVIVHESFEYLNSVVGGIILGDTRVRRQPPARAPAGSA